MRSAVSGGKSISIFEKHRDARFLVLFSGRSLSLLEARRRAFLKVRRNVRGKFPTLARA